ncbi:MAG TPA: peptidylprolyl isomerase [Gammaproteobacteria bacterium]|nr:peptidylprolyl isomerase [Gammaproteobacteria bacterium]
MRAFVVKSLKDPLLHFLVIGIALFAASAWRGQSIRAGRERIVVGAEQVVQARDAATALEGRALTRDELAELIEPTVREEVLYREALALRLDENDDEVRRRLVEKMQYLTQDLADPEAASEAELEAFYAAHPERFAVPELVTFEQVFFDPGKRGAALQADATAGLAKLAAGAAPRDVGDRTPLRESYANAPREQVTILFGGALADAVFSVAPGAWVGPFRSDFGLHVVRLNARTERTQPPYPEIRDRVAAEFASDRRRARNDADYARMRSHYDVVIEWPADEK